MAEELIQYEVKDRVAYLTINRPERRNSFSENTRRKLIDSWMDFKNDDEIDVAILTGAGNIAFTAGSDLREIARGLEIENPDWQPPVGNISSIGLAAMQGLNIEKPVIAAVNGYSLGFGFALALACDIRIATPNARFAASEVKYGHMAGGGQATRLAKMIPMGWAMELALTGDQIDAETALRIGVVNRVVPEAKLIEECTDIAQRMIECGPTVVRETKAFMYRSLGLPLDEALDLEGVYYARIQASEDYDIGTTAFADKTKPQFERK